MIIFHALAVLILLLLFIFRLSRAFCWFCDWFFRVLGGDGSAIDCHLSNAHLAAPFNSPTSAHVESVQWCNFSVYLKMEKFSVRCFPNRHVMQQRMGRSGDALESGAEANLVHQILSRWILESAWKIFFSRLSLSTVQKPTRRNFRFSSAPSHPADSVKFEKYFNRRALSSLFNYN